MKGLYEYFCSNKQHKYLEQTSYNERCRTREDYFFRFVECLFGKEKKNQIAILAVQNRRLFENFLQREDYRYRGHAGGNSSKYDDFLTEVKIVTKFVEELEISLGQIDKIEKAVNTMSGQIADLLRKIDSVNRENEQLRSEMENTRDEIPKVVCDFFELNSSVQNIKEKLEE